MAGWEEVGGEGRQAGGMSSTWPPAGGTGPSAFLVVGRRPEGRQAGSAESSGGSPGGQGCHGREHGGRGG